MEFLKGKLENNLKLYDKVLLEEDEYNLLNNKTFKTIEVNDRLNELQNEIINTKQEVSKEVVKWYKNYYTNKGCYKYVSKKEDDKLTYEIGYICLDDFFNYKEWPSIDVLNILKRTRLLNREKCENYIRRIEIIKNDYPNIYNNYLNEKKDEMSQIKKEMTSLIPNWEDPVILIILNDKLNKIENKIEVIDDLFIDEKDFKVAR